MIAAKPAVTGDSREGIGRRETSRNALARLVDRALRPPLPFALWSKRKAAGRRKVANRYRVMASWQLGFTKQHSLGRVLLAEVFIAPPPR